ncbi:hypothetical protein GW17_00023825 [Ensete ventricosum]|uniref:Uncharacterized protein n=1 Tax=Ensete ventricosum TaxID=4639 RepID=A0A444EQ86_ENSVE|nr:hypothetical protein B296_00044284 [Ensete ventricosum]RWW12503.1 hypothetical protein GW17_00023825 [Ensete ventricosum]RZR86882.1 hypothetical protein BHM03_00014169 [Ensete ventricosum]
MFVNFRYLHRWDLDPAIDVLTMCICHLPPNEPLRSEVNTIVQDDCKKDPEGLALRLAGKGAVFAALEVAESASLSVELRRELQGRQLVKLLTTDPLSGGGPAEASRSKQKTRSGTPSMSNFASSIGNWQREARRAFSWTNRDNAPKILPKDVHRKRKSSGFMHSDRVAWEAMSGIQEERATAFSADGQERLPFVCIAEEWVLTGDPIKDNAVRASHRYETSPDITLFKALISLCSDELASARGALQLYIWLGRAELLQSLLGSGIIASLDDIADKESSARLRDRLIVDERQALQLHKGDPAAVILDIINTVEGGPPVDVPSIRSM